MDGRTLPAPGGEVNADVAMGARAQNLEARTAPHASSSKPSSTSRRLRIAPKLERPNRITRVAVLLPRGWATGLHTLHAHAANALEELLAMPPRPEVPSTELLGADHARAALFRARFEQERGMARADHCLFDLRRSHDAEVWVDAADCLVAQVGDGPNAEPRMRGEPLRADASPSVTDWMSRRAADALRGGEADAACALAWSAIDWDRAAASRWALRFERACRRNTDCRCADLLRSADGSAETGTSR